MLQLARFTHASRSPASLERAGNLLGHGYQFTDIYSEGRQEHCRIYYSDEAIVVAFEGSSIKNPGHHTRNMDFGRKHPFRFGVPKMELSAFGDSCRIHPGFAKSMRKPVDGDIPDAPSFEEAVAEAVGALYNETPRRIDLVGYSAGAPFAGIMASYLATHQPELPLHDIYSFGAPRYCGKNFAKALEDSLQGNYYRFEVFKDPVTAWPRYEADYYVHPGKQIVFDTSGQLIAPCLQTGHPSDSYSDAKLGVIDLSLRKMGRPMHFMKHYHDLSHYADVLDQFAQKQIGNISIPALHPIRLDKRTHHQKHPMGNVAQSWFDQVINVVSKHIRKADIDDRDLHMLEDKLSDFKRCVGSRNFSDFWLEDSQNTLADLFLALEEKAPLAKHQMEIIGRGLLGLEKRLEREIPIQKQVKEPPQAALSA